MTNSKSLFAIAIALLLPVSAMAKARTVQLSITGPGLSEPIHTTAPSAISASVWGGNFIELDGGPVPEPDISLPRYYIHFWVEASSWQEAPADSVQMKYVVWYVWEPIEERAFLYLPGQSDTWYRTNVRSIFRSGNEGNWFFASDMWGQVIRDVLRNAPDG